ncbi:DUF2933 domain-containing protein [Paraburkholderia aspalathi]|nr:DUF2933 domain-containing protein [Paraburkholderia aspalathi]
MLRLRSCGRLNSGVFCLLRRHLAVFFGLWPFLVLLVVY